MRLFHAIAAGNVSLAASCSAAAALAAELSTNRPHQADTAVGEAIRAEVDKARAWLTAGDYSKAEAVLRLALGSADRDPDEYVRSLRNGLADLLREEGRFAEARQFYTSVLNAPGVTVYTRQQILTRLSGPIADLDGSGSQSGALAVEQNGSGRHHGGARQ